ncbi:MAG: MptD family putative ECF transporter S component [Bacteroidales bacterium]|nr:MptD family putative ECF transporter S component [Bacteroidales bacterium]
MDKKLTFWSAAVFVVLYFVALFAAEFIGFAHPVCWVFAPAIGALLGALPYRWLSLRWRGFGLGTVLAAVFGLAMLAMGELDVICLAICVGCGVLSDVVQLTAKSDCWAYPVLAIGNIAEIIYLWIRKEWYLQGAANEMGQAYADAMAPMQNTLWFVVAVVAIVVAAECGLWIAKKLIK